MLRAFPLVIAVSLLFAGAHALAAQTPSPWGWSLRADNDAFNLWQSVSDRPDGEYSNGVQLTRVTGSAPWWGERFAKGRDGCTGAERPDERCLATEFTFGQDIYTPDKSRMPGEVEHWERERPYAGWLYLAAAGRVLDARAMREVRVTLGVTGRPSLAEAMQKWAHRVNAAWTDPPVGWETQVRFEPGLVLGARQWWIFADGDDGEGSLVQVIPSAGVSVGNVLVRGDAGLEARLGWNLSHPWRPAGTRARSPVSLALVAGARQYLVARDVTLDGNSFGATRSVTREPWVGEYEVGIEARVRAITIGWRAVTRGREYTTGPHAHAVGSFRIGISQPAPH